AALQREYRRQPVRRELELVLVFLFVLVFVFVVDYGQRAGRSRAGGWEWGYRGPRALLAAGLVGPGWRRDLAGAGAGPALGASAVILGSPPAPHGRGSSFPAGAPDR